MALSIFRLASILTGVGARAAQGNASSSIAAQVGSDAVVRSLAQKGLQLAGVPLPARQQPAVAATSTSGGNGGGGQQPPGGSSAAAAAGAVTLGLGPSPRVRQLLQKLHRFMRDHVYPAGGPDCVTVWMFD